MKNKDLMRQLLNRTLIVQRYHPKWCKEWQNVVGSPTDQLAYIASCSQDLSEWQFRVKPEPKPDVVRYALCKIGVNPVWDNNPADYYNMKATFDGETFALKKLEMI